MRFGIGGPVAALALFAATAAWAAGKGEAYPPIPDPDAVIEHCSNISRALRSSPSTSDLNSGHMMTIRCLTDNIQENLSILTGKDHIDKSSQGSYEPQTFPEFFEALTKTLDDFYSEVHYGPKICSPRCGTIASNLVLSDIVNIYREMLRDVLHARKIRGS